MDDTENQDSELPAASMSRIEKINRWLSTFMEVQIEEDEMPGLYQSLGMNPENLRSKCKVIQMAGVKVMSTSDVLDYFAGYGAKEINWFGKDACYVTFENKIDAATALLDLSLPFITQDENQEEDSDAYEKIWVPPGNWRLGLPHHKEKEFFLRFATREDKGGSYHSHFRWIERQSRNPSNMRPPFLARHMFKSSGTSESSIGESDNPGHNLGSPERPSWLLQHN